MKPRFRYHSVGGGKLPKNRHKVLNNDGGGLTGTLRGEPHTKTPLPMNGIEEKGWAEETTKMEVLLFLTLYGERGTIRRNLRTGSYIGVGAWEHLDLLLYRREAKHWQNLANASPRGLKGMCPSRLGKG